MILVIMGVSGAGKTTVGRQLADQLGWTYFEGDDYHPAANVEKMRRGVPLQDEDRWPWLAALRELIAEAHRKGGNVVLACSVLKQSYRDELSRGAPGDVRFVYLRGSEELVKHRLAGRKGHFMNPALLHSQFEALEPPNDAIVADIARDPHEIVDQIRHTLSLPDPS
jgi:gluconokinase